MTDIPSWCHRGAKVECVLDPTAELIELFPTVIWPVVGGAYTLGSIKATDEVVLVLIDEIVNQPLVTIRGIPVEPWFPLFLFRPLVKRNVEADLALFKHLLGEVEIA